MLLPLHLNIPFFPVAYVIPVAGGVRFTSQARLRFRRRPA